eukprot:6204615-Pleurochrysis_carterae.AAC.5
MARQLLIAVRVRADVRACMQRTCKLAGECAWLGAPSAHTACSLTSIESAPSRLMSGGTEPASTTAWHWIALPDATLVTHHAASKAITSDE